MPDTYRYVIYTLLLVVAFVYAGVRGGAPERLAALVIFLNVALSALAATPFERHFLRLEVGVLAGDMLALVALTAIALCADRSWPAWVAGIKLIQVIAHFPIILKPNVIPHAYYAIQAALSYPKLIILIVAVRRHRQRLKRFGTDRSWSSSFDLSWAMPR